MIMPLRGKNPVLRALTCGVLVLVGIVVAADVAGIIHSGGRLRSMAGTKASAIRLWHVGKALRDYRSLHGRLPPLALRDAGGKPHLSWRVQLLPLLGQEALYRQFHLDEPWDSKHNASLIAQMLPVYSFDPGNRNRDVKACLGKTCYLALTGDSTIFAGSGSTDAVSAEQMDTSRIILVEVDEECATTWTKPDDVAMEMPPKRSRGVLGRRDGKVLCLLANGWVVLVNPEDINDKDVGKKATVVLKEVFEGESGDTNRF